MILDWKGRRRVLIGALLCLAFIFLFARLQRPQAGNDCVTYVVVGNSAHFVHVCDTYGLTEAMDNLGRFLTTSSPWRVHTVYILVGAALAAAFSPVAELIRWTLLDGHVTGGVNISTFLQRFPDYFALMIVNFLILAAALSIALRLVGARDGGLAAALAAAIATSDLVHGHFWSQHPMFMNLIVPLGCIFYFVWGCRARETGYAAIVGFGLAAAACILTYSFTMIWLPAFVLGALYRDWRMGTTLADTMGSLPGVLIAFAVAGCGPVLAWLAINMFYLHVNISYEAENLKMFTWLADAWREGRLGAALTDHWHGYLARVWAWLGWQGPVSLASIMVLVCWGHRRWPLAQAGRDPIIVAVLMTIAFMLIFNFLQGLYEPRMVNGITLALFVALARVAQKTECLNWGTGILFAISAGQIGYAFLQPAISVS